jgi:glycerophosphoryl diester phosphodiesterase
MNPIVAHRGWSSKAPENTLASVKLALEEEKIDVIEIDIHMTKDEVIVVAHDFILGRTANGSGYISNYTYKELLKYDFGSWFSEKFIGERIPRLEEILEITDGKKELIIEIKNGANKYLNIAEKLCSLLRDYKYKDKIRVKSFNHEVIKEISEIESSIKTGLLIYGMPILLKEQINYTKTSFISMNYEYITKDLVENLIKTDIDVMAWTVNTKEDIENIKNISKEIYIVTDYPQNIF